MADETEKLLQEMKEVLTSVKEVGKYAADLTAALGNMARPIQQSSEYMKVVSEQAAQAQKDTAAMFEVQKKMTENLSSSVELLKGRNKLTQEEHDLNVKIKELHAENIRLRNEKLLKSATDKEKYIEERDHGMLMNALAREQIGIFEQITSGVGKLHDKLLAAGKELKVINGLAQNKSGIGAFMARRAAGAISNASNFVTGTGNAGAGMAALAGSAMSTFAPLMGVGGFLGAMIHGVHRQEGFRAAAETIAQQFDQIGGHTSKITASLNGMIRSMEVYGYGSREDIMAAASAFRQFGIDAETAMKKVDGFKSVIGSSLMAATIAVDKQLELAAGTTAAWAGTLQADFNVSAGDAVGRLREMGDAAGRAGMNVATFMQQTMDAASAVRMLNANWEDFGHLQMKLGSTMVGMGFNTKKDAVFRQNYMAAGATSLGQAVGGMDEGLAGWLAQELGAGEGIDAIYSMKSPLARKANDKLSIDKIAKKMLQTVRGMSGKRSEQWFALQKVFGLDTAGADMVLSAGDELDKTGAMSATTKMGLSRGIASEADKRNRMDQNVEIIKDAVANILVGLLGIVINSLKLLYNGIVWVGAKVANAFGGDSDSKRLEKESWDNMTKNVGTIGDAFAGFAPELKKIKDASGSTMNLLGMNTDDMTTLKSVVRAISAGDPKKDLDGRAKEIAAGAMGDIHGVLEERRRAALKVQNETGRPLTVTVQDPAAPGNKSFSGQE